MSEEKKTLRLLRTGAPAERGSYRYEGHSDPTKRACVSKDGQPWTVAAGTVKQLPACPGCGGGAIWSEQ